MGTGRTTLTKHPPLALGPLPVEAINATLGTELEAGDVHLSARAHEHIARDHSADYATVMLHLRATIAEPTFVEQAPKRRENANVALVRRVPLTGGRGYVLLAVGLEPDERGRYRVRTGYLIREDVVTARRAKGYMRPIKR